MVLAPDFVTLVIVPDSIVIFNWRCELFVIMEDDDETWLYSTILIVAEKFPEIVSALFAIIIKSLVVYLLVLIV